MIARLCLSAVSKGSEVRAGKLSEKSFGRLRKISPVRFVADWSTIKTCSINIKSFDINFGVGHSSFEKVVDSSLVELCDGLMLSSSRSLLGA